MSTDGTIYAARIRYTELIQRGEANTTELKIYQSGAQVIPTAATLTALKPDGLGIVQDIAATVEPDGTCLYTFPSNQIPETLPLGEGYLLEWTATISGKQYTFRRTAAVTLRKLYPTVSDIDLIEEYANLDSLRPASLSSYEQYILSAWAEILRKIRNMGIGYEYLVLSPEAFHDSLKHLALYKIFRDFHSALSQSNGRFLDLANEHYANWKREFSSVNMIYDETHKGRSDQPEERTRGRPVIYLTAPSPYRFLKRK